MSAKSIILGVAAVAIIGAGVATYISYANLGNRLENGITAQYEQNQNKLSQMSNSVMDAAQVPAMAKDHLKEVIKESMAGRYGNDKTLMFKAVTEAYPGTLDPSLYAKLQNLIESGRTDFAAEQQTMIDKTRVYKTTLGNVWGGFWLNIAGYPKINLDDYKIVISDYTAEAFKTKRDNGLKLGN